MRKMKVENKGLKQLTGCVGCDRSRKMFLNEVGKFELKKETCSHGGLVSVDGGHATPFRCNVRKDR